MPIHECKLPDGGKGFAWGSGTCYADRKDAEKQAEAAYSNGYTGDEAGKFTGTERREADKDHAKREDMPGEAFLEPGSRKYPVKVKRDGQWKYDRDLLLAAERDAERFGHHDLAERAKAIRKREFGMASDALTLAIDRSMRTTDAVGRLHIAVSNISKAMVCPYHATEIPDSVALGLDQDRVYYLLRDPAELERAAPTANNIQLLYRHIAVSASAPQKDDTVGSTGTDAEFVAPYLRNSLVVWDAVAIAGIESREQCELSCGYAYEPDMTPGVYEGVPYDGVMRNLVFNHVALVEVGRAGPDVVVGDSNPFINHEVAKMKASGKTIAVRAALKAHLRPLLAQDCKLDINHIVGNIRTETLAMDALRISRAISKQATYAADAKAKDEDVEDLVKKAAEDESEEEAHKDDVEGGEKANKKLDDEDPQREGESDEDYAKRKKGAADKRAKDEEEAKAKEDEKEGGRKANEKLDEERKDAHDAALERRTVDRMNAIFEAKEAVMPLVGKLGAFDSAEAVYRFALDHLGVDTKGVHPSAFRPLVQAHMALAAKPKMANDSAGSADFVAQFPGAAKLKRI